MATFWSRCARTRVLPLSAPLAASSSSVSLRSAITSPGVASQTWKPFFVSVAPGGSVVTSSFTPALVEGSCAEASVVTDGVTAVSRGFTSVVGFGGGELTRGALLGTSFAGARRLPITKAPTAPATSTAPTPTHSPSRLCSPPAVGGGIDDSYTGGPLGSVCARLG